MKRAREKAATQIFDEVGHYASALGSADIAARIREQQLAAMERLLRWIDQEGGFRTLEDGIRPDLEKMLDEEGPA